MSPTVALQRTAVAEARTQTGRHLSIGVMNGLSLSVGSSPLPLASRKARALLAFLALEHAPSVRRDKLASLFWSESSERHARNSLRQILFELREALAGRGCEALESGRDVRLILAEVELDLDQAITAIAAGQLPETLNLASPGRDLLLAGYEDLSPEFGEWIETTRRAVQHRLMRAIESAYIDIALAPLDRRHLAAAAIRMEPLHEGACRVLMRLAAEAGEVGLALRTYAALYDAMGMELDMEPSETTQALVAEIKLGRLETQQNAARGEQPGVAEKTVSTASSVLAGGIPVVAILPFRSTGNEETTIWIADAICEDLVRMLAHLREPAVISSNSTRHLRNSAEDLATVGHRLGAGYLVTGSVRIAGNSGRIAVELSQTATGVVLWSDSYEFSTANVFETLEQIAANVANALGPRVDAAELHRGLAQRVDDLDAYQLLLRARELIFQMNRATLEQAGLLIAEALHRAPSYAGAHALHAYWRSLRIFQGWSPDTEADKAMLMEAVHTALRLDPNHARALALLGHNLMMTEHRYDEAEVLVDRAVALSPNDSDVLITATPTCAYVGRATEAIRRAERGLRLSPRDPFLFRYEHFCSIAHFAADDYEQAAYWGLRSWLGNPNFTSNLRATIAALSALGRIEEARPLVERHHLLQPDFRAASVIDRYSLRERSQREHFSKLLSEAGLR